MMPATWLLLATLAPPSGPGGACLSAVSLTPAMASGDGASFEARYGHCEGAAAFRVVQLWIGDEVTPQSLRVNLGYEAGRFFIEGGGDCAPQDPVVLTSTYGSLDCALSSVSLVGNEMIVQWAVGFDVASFAGLHGVFFDAKGGTGDPEPRLGWTQMGTFEVVAQDGGESTSLGDGGASSSSGGGSDTGGDGSSDASTGDGGSTDDGALPGTGPQQSGASAGCACDSRRGGTPPWWLFVLLLARRSRTRAPGAASELPLTPAVERA